MSEANDRATQGREALVRWQAEELDCGFSHSVVDDYEPEGSLFAARCIGMRAALQGPCVMLVPVKTEHLRRGVTVGFVEEAESGGGQFLVVLVQPDLVTSLHVVSDVDKLLRRTGTPSGAVPLAVFQVDRESFCQVAGLKPVFPQTVGFGWAASVLAAAPIVPEQRATVLRYLGGLDTDVVARVLVEWQAATPAEPRLRAERRDLDLSDYLDD